MNTLKLILVSVEDPDRQTPAIRRAAELARRTGAALHLCFTVFNRGVDAAAELVYADIGLRARTEFIEQRRDALAEQVATLRASGIQVASEVLWSGKPHDAILARTLDLQPDLVVRDVVRESFLGRWSTVRRSDWQLARQCPAPLMLVQKPGILLPKHIAAAVDPGRSEVPGALELDDRVVRTALPIAMAAEADLQLVHVCHYRDRLTGIGPNLNEYLDRLQRDDDAAYLAFAQRHGVPPEHRVRLAGEPGHELINYVDSAGIDLMVMGSEHRTGFERFMIGSTAEAVVGSGGCDVLLVRPNGFAESLGQHRDLEELRALYREPTDS